MKRIAALIALTVAWNASAVEWLTDLPTALNKARVENKSVLIDFTGSDWCGWCKRLKAEVFDKPEFAAFADANLILVEADFPRAKKISPQQREANEQLARRYNIRGYPTIILIDAAEKNLGETGYVAGGPKPFISNLENILKLKHNDPAPAQVTSKPAAKPAEKFELPPAAAKIEYNEIALKAISGSKNKRLALINNQSLAQGETAMIKHGEKKIKLLCKEIREDSVLVQLDDQPQLVELSLGKIKTSAGAPPK